MKSTIPTVSVLLDVDDGSTLTADAIVVGTGAGGAAVAGELSRLGASVLLVEAGELDPEIGLGEHVHTAIPAESQLESDYGPAVWTRLGSYQRATERMPGLPGAATTHSVGGLLSLWSHVCARPDPETEGEPSIPADELARLWDAAEALLWADVSIESGGVRQQRIQAELARLYPDLPRDRGVQQLPTAMRRKAGGGIEWAGIGALLDPLDTVGAGQVRIVPGFPVRRIEQLPGGAINVVAADWSGGRTIRLAGRAAISAGGAIGAPQLLHASGIRPPALGRYVTDHTMIGSRVKLRDDLLVDVPKDDPTFSVWVPASRDRPIHTQIVRGWVASAPFVGELDHRLTADIAQFAGVDPDPQNRLVFDEDRPDAWGMPSVSARFELGDADRARVKFAFADHYDIVATLGDPAYGVAVSLAAPGTSLHIMGSTRIGSDPDTSTADSVGRVWGTESVYVAGNGVISTLNAGNPTLNTVALGLRTARAIAGSAS